MSRLRSLPPVRIRKSAEIHATAGTTRRTAAGTSAHICDGNVSSTARHFKAKTAAITAVTGNINCPGIQVLELLRHLFFPPVPIASTSIMVADPTTIPMEVRITLNLFCDRFNHTRRNISDNLIFYFFPSIDLTFPQVSALLRNAAFDQYGISFCNISGDLHVRTI